MERVIIVYDTKGGSMNKWTFPLVLVIIISLVAGCGRGKNTTEDKETTMRNQAEVITPQQAKEIMEEQKDCIILDVREQDEYDEGHISGAVLIPYTEILKKAETMLKDKEQLILVYCRSGRRSAIAAAALADMGYNNVKDFGGIIDWPYEIVK